MDMKNIANHTDSISIGGIDIELKPFVLNDYLLVLDELVSILGKIVEKYPDFDLDKIGVLDLLKLRAIIPDVLQILDAMLKLDKGFLGANSNLLSAVKLINKLLKINSVKEIKENLKIAKALLKDEK